MFIRDQASVPPARSVDETGPTDRPVDGVAGGNAAEDAALPGADRRRSPRTKGGAR